MQVVLAESAALRLPAGASGHTSATFCLDMLSAVPLARWDWEHHAAASSASGRLPARFGGFLPGGSWFAALSSEVHARLHSDSSLFHVDSCYAMEF